MKSATMAAAVLLLLSQAAMADTGVMGGWAADPADCRYVSDRAGVTQNVTAGIITPENVFFHGGECYFANVYPRPDGYIFDGVCDEGDGEYEERLETKQTGPNEMRAMWPDIGWTTFHRCWDLPADWRKRTQ